jgi:hypothetical protein
MHVREGKEVGQKSPAIILKHGKFIHVKEVKELGIKQQAYDKQGASNVVNKGKQLGV